MQDVLYILKPCECRKCGTTITIRENSLTCSKVTEYGEPIDTESISEFIGYCDKCGERYNNIGIKGMHYYIKTQEQVDNPYSDNPFVK